MLGNYNREYDVRCKLDSCKTYPVVTDSERGEILCSGCGLVLVQNLEDFSYESHGYTQQEFMTQTRTGPGISLTMHDKGLSTIIGSNKDSTGTSLSNRTKLEFNRLRMWDQRSRSKTTSSLSKAFTILHGMKTKLSIPDSVVEQAAYNYRKAVLAKLTRGRTMSSLIAASLYAACRENNIPRTLDDIASAANVERRLLSRDLRTLVIKLELNLNQYDTSAFIIKLANNMSIKEKTKRDAIEIFKKCESERITSGKHPVAQAAAVIYLACLANNEKISQRKLSENSGVSDVTIRNRVNFIKKFLKLNNGLDVR